MKVFNPVFSINIASKPKNNTIKVSGSKVSRKCLATVIKDDNGEYKAVINYNHKEIQVTSTFTLHNEVLVIPFTKNSLSLKNKPYVFLKNKDEFGHNVVLIRNDIDAKINCGNSSQYDAVKENILIAGHIIKKDGKMYFEYENLIAYNYSSEYYIQTIKIDESKPLFNT